jgi:ATP-dependent DNA ligase
MPGGRLRPMLATLTEVLMIEPGWLYEPKYDGIRAIIEVPLNEQVRIWSRLS